MISNNVPEVSVADVRLTFRNSMRGRIANILDSTIFYSLLLLMFFTAIPYGAVEPLWVGLFESAVYSLAALSTIEGALRGNWLVKQHRVLVPLFVLAGFMFVQTLSLPAGDLRIGDFPVWRAISADPFETRLIALKLFALILVAAMLVRYTSSPRRLRVLVGTVVAIAVLSAIFGLLRQTSQREGMNFLLPYLRANVGFGQFINKNHFAFLAEMALGLTLGIVVRRGVSPQRYLLFLAPALPLWTAIILSGSRGGILAMLSQVLFLGLMFERREQAPAISRQEGDPGLTRSGKRVRLCLRFGFASMLVILVFAGMVWIGGEPVIAQMGTVGDEVTRSSITDPSRTGRTALWVDTLKLILAHPIFGVGFGGYWTAITAFHQGNGTLVPQQAHNDYLEFMASGGVVGLLLAGWAILLLIRGVWTKLCSSDAFSRAVAFGAIVGLFGSAIHSLFDFGAHVTINALIMVALFVLTIVNTGPEPLSGAEQ